MEMETCSEREKEMVNEKRTQWEKSYKWLDLIENGRKVEKFIASQLYENMHEKSKFDQIQPIYAR